MKKSDKVVVYSDCEKLEFLNGKEGVVIETYGEELIRVLMCNDLWVLHVDDVNKVETKRGSNYEQERI